MSSSMVLLFTSPYFRGIITDTPSGTAYNVKPGQTIAAAEEDVSLLRTFGFTPAPGQSVSVIGAGTTVDNVSSFIFTGASITNLGSGAVGVGVSGGSGGTLSAGIGIDPVLLAEGTVANNGTIRPPASTDSNPGNGISLYAATGNNPSGAAQGAVANLYGGGATGAAGSNVFAGQATISNGNVTDGTKTIVSSYLILNGGGIYPDGSSFPGGLRFAGGVAINGSATETGAYIIFIAGTAANATGTNIGGPNRMYGGPADGSGVTNIGGALYGIGGTAGVGTPGTSNTGGAASWEGGFGIDLGGLAKVQGGGAGGSGIGGALQLGGGPAATNGGIILDPLPGTTDPLTMGELFLHSISTVGFVVVVSEG